MPTETWMNEQFTYRTAHYHFKCCLLFIHYYFNPYKELEQLGKRSKRESESFLSKKRSTGNGWIYFMTQHKFARSFFWCAKMVGSVYVWKSHYHVRCKSSHLNKIALYCVRHCLLFLVVCLIFSELKTNKRRKLFPCFMILCASIMIIVCCLCCAFSVF